ncbi:hypothetical protein CFP71_01700 [Amycolatopsis thailandensis]|uniref:PrsW family intramembrane metalloprotease n=1 Tax=Amycolatopsis thailandensis TaxID=589330 RepID=A0A229SID1_9PSEU|nr:PrsW family intramembrane metalloprotease [Amycolatopsis thailandensis]OXM58606.1 hypothetical protein CFP71_01700 [Amycolatopsis thailandensis]
MTQRFSQAEVSAAARLQASIDTKLGRDPTPPRSHETAVPTSDRPVSPDLRAAAAQLHRKISRRLNRDPMPSVWVGILRPPIVLTVLSTLLLVALKVNPVAALVAVLSVSFPVGVLRWIDRWRPKTEGQFWRSFGRGAWAGFIVLLVMEAMRARQGTGATLERLLGEPMLAELLKGIFVILIVIRMNGDLDRMLDWIVYGGFVAAGFAFIENVFSFAAFHAGVPTAAPGEVAAFTLRGVLTPFMNLLCTCLIVVGVALAIRTRRLLVQLGAPLLGTLGAVWLHSVWIRTETLPPAAFINVYFLIMVPVFALTALVVYHQHARDLRALAAELPDLVADKVVVPAELVLLSSLRARRHWRTAVRKRSGIRTARAVAQYQEAVTELAVLRRSIRAGDVGSGVRARELDLMREVARTQVEATWLDGAVTSQAKR